MLTLGGCSKDQIFAEEKVPDSINPLKRTQLEDGKYYIKDGTDFYLAYNADSSFTNGTDTADAKSRIVWTSESEEALIPTLYKGEILAFCTTSSLPENFTLERFKDLGYSFGIRNLDSGTNSYYSTSLRGVLKSGSDIETILSPLDTNEIGISAVSGNAVEKEDISECGTIKGLERNKTYDVDIYIGSVYAQKEIKADTRVFQSSEIIKITDFTLTKNSYIQIGLPEDLKSGFYYIDGAGMFRYIEEPRYEAKEIEVYDYNEKNDESLLASTAVDDTLEVEEKEETFVLDKTYNHVQISVTASKGQEISAAVLTLPDGNVKQLKEDIEGSLTYKVTLDVAEAGEYTVYIKGKNIQLIVPNVSNGSELLDATNTSDDSNTDTNKVEDGDAGIETDDDATSGNDQTNGEPETSSSNAEEGESGYVYYEEPVTDPLYNPEQSETMKGQ